MANQPEPSANPTIDLTADVPADESPVGRQVDTADPNSLQAIAVRALATPQRITLSSRDMSTENLINVIDEQCRIIRWQRDSITRLEAFPGRDTLEDTIVQKNERIKNIGYRIHAATRFFGRKKSDAERHRLTEENEELASDRDRWMGIAQGIEYWLPTMGDNQNVFGENIQVSPEEGPAEGLFPPEVFEVARHKGNPEKQLRKKDANMLRREIKVLDKAKRLVDNAEAGFLGASDTATSSRENERPIKRIKLSLKAARERDALLAMQADVSGRPNVASHQPLSAVNPPEALRNDVSRSLAGTAVAEATDSGHDVGDGEKSSHPAVAKGKGVLRIVTTPSPPRDVQASAPSAPNTQKRKHVSEDTAAALGDISAPTMPEPGQPEHSGIRAKKRRRVEPQAPAVTRQKLPRACKKDRKY